MLPFWRLHLGLFGMTRRASRPGAVGLLLTDNIEVAMSGLIPGPLSGARVLLVEDHADTREIYGRVLAEQGAVVTATGQVGVALEGLGIVDIVVTDVALPDADGVELLEQARVKAPGVPVIGISGYAKEQTPRLAAAFDLLLLTPVDPWDLAKGSWTCCGTGPIPRAGPRRASKGRAATPCLAPQPRVPPYRPAPTTSACRPSHTAAGT